MTTNTIEPPTMPTAKAQREENLRVAALSMLGELELLEIELQSFLDCGTNKFTDEWLLENLASIRAILAEARTKIPEIPEVPHAP